MQYGTVRTQHYFLAMFNLQSLQRQECMDPYRSPRVPHTEDQVSMFRLCPVSVGLQSRLPSWTWMLFVSYRCISSIWT